ncbi:MAG: preprotein translocase subunit YajC [Clostridia bacterium]|nr:preprotein translocase subunit YajC [Clostridia bacterium]
MLNALLNANTADTSFFGRYGTIIMLVLIIVVFYFFLIRPQKKQEKEANDMRNSLSVGDEVVTIGGIIGQIVSVKNETVTIVTSKDRTKLRFLKTAIREVSAKAGTDTESEPKADDAKPEIKD